MQEEENLDGLKIKSVFFDGRRDKTLFIGKKRTSDIRRQKDEEHITLLSEPGSQYLRHLTSRSGHGEEIAASMFFSRYREDSSTFEIPYFVAKVAKFVAKVRGPDVAAVDHLILTPVKLSSQP
ncbi:hypothetical protein AVEN_121180-1 [Araneus ventricosus]|uniref:Uncharacterized protein n=1 Tax=Araneus ventricosus TaxID=182803 RepID=A0A4Y2KM50_ARAVE|nr:hypothetical protein AVEN_121180-1 [Araneus ventricosus]